jgi:hypothetical protein
VTGDLTLEARSGGTVLKRVVQTGRVSNFTFTYP